MKRADSSYATSLVLHQELKNDLSTGEFRVLYRNEFAWIRIERCPQCSMQITVPDADCHNVSIVHTCHTIWRPCILREAHTLGLLGVCDGAIFLDNLIDSYLVQILQIQARLAWLYYVADDVVHVAEEKEAGGAAAKVQITESIYVASAAIIEEVDEIVVVVEPEYYIIAPGRHDKDAFRTAKSGAQQLTDAIVASILGANNGHRFRYTQQSRVMIGLCAEHIMRTGWLGTWIQWLYQFWWLGTWWTLLDYGLR